jgi:hypothetical protein
MPLLKRYRNRGVFLDSTRSLTWGPAIVPFGALLSTFSSLTGVFTLLSESQEQEAIIGQVIHNQGSPFAHFTFLSPREQMGSPKTANLLEQLAARVGARGVQSLIAEVEESAPAYAALRDASFSVYARQRIWRINTIESKEIQGARWRMAAPSDSLSVDLLCSSLVPSLVQQVEPTPWDALSGRVLIEAGELRAYVDLRTGPRGIWIQPFVHLDAQDLEKGLIDLIGLLAPRPKRPIYICVRSYQEWLGASLRNIGAEEGPLQALMLRRTSGKVKLRERKAIIKRNGRRAEPSTPIRVPLSRAKLDMELAKHDQT